MEVSELPAETLPLNNKCHSSTMLDADDKIKQLIYCFALLMSSDRSSHSRGNRRSAGSEVTACALREQPRAPGAKVYTLYAAMNKGIKGEDEFYVRMLEKWVKSSEENIDTLYELVLKRLIRRSQSYLHGISDKLENVTGISTWTRELVDLHRQLAERYNHSTEEEDRHRLELAAHFVTKNRKNANDIGFCRSDQHRELEKMWDEIERLSRIPIAVNRLNAFRIKVTDTGSDFRIVRVNPSHNETSLAGVDFESSENIMFKYVEHVHEGGINQLCMNKANFESWKKSQTLANRAKNVHCEIQLLEQLLVTDKKLGLLHVYNYIGCSKEPCWLCDSVIRTGTGFNMAKSHAGFYWNWTMPNSVARLTQMTSALQEVDRTMLGIIRDARFVSQNQWPQWTDIIQHCRHS